MNERTQIDQRNLSTVTDEDIRRVVAERDLVVPVALKMAAHLRGEQVKIDQEDLKWIEGICPGWREEDFNRFVEMYLNRRTLDSVCEALKLPKGTSKEEVLSLIGRMKM